MLYEFKLTNVLGVLAVGTGLYFSYRYFSGDTKYVTDGSEGGNSVSGAEGSANNE